MNKSPCSLEVERAPYKRLVEVRFLPGAVCRSGGTEDAVDLKSTCLNGSKGSSPFSGIFCQGGGMADTEDSKSSAHYERKGSSPFLGIFLLTNFLIGG